MLPNISRGFGPFLAVPRSFRLDWLVSRLFAEFPLIPEKIEIWAHSRISNFRCKSPMRPGCSLGCSALPMLIRHLCLPLWQLAGTISLYPDLEYGRRLQARSPRKASYCTKVGGPIFQAQVNILTTLSFLFTSHFTEADFDWILPVVGVICFPNFQVSPSLSFTAFICSFLPSQVSLLPWLTKGLSSTLFSVFVLVLFNAETPNLSMLMAHQPAVQ